MIERASQLSRDLIELLGGDAELAMGLFQPEGGASWLRGSKREGSTGDVADPQRAHELQPWQPVQLVGMPLTKLGVLRCLADDGVLDDRIAGGQPTLGCSPIGMLRLSARRPRSPSRRPVP